jgi:hypothetical protein
MSAVLEHVEQARQPIVMASSPAQAVALAMERGDLEQVAKFMDLQERWEANEARKAYNIAVANFKAEAVTIIRARETTDGPLKGRKYAELYSIVNAVTPALSKHGLSTSWKLSKDEKDWIEVTCTLRHVAGHSESVSMGGAPDTGPGRNAIQSRASTVTYLEKYTIKAILGVSDQGDDNDGAGSGKSGGQPTLDENQVANIEALLTEYGANKAQFLKFAKVTALSEILAKNYEAACREIRARKSR